MRKILLGSIATVLLTTNMGAQIHPTDPKRPGVVPQGAQQPGGDSGRTQTNAPSMAELNVTYARLAKSMRVIKSGEFKSSTALEPPEFANLKLQKQAADAEAGQIMSAPGGSSGSGPNGMLRTGMATAAAPAQKSPGMLTASNVTVCTNTAIYAVNRVKAGAIFTTDRSTNLYTITGCGFGATPGKLFLEGGPGAFPAHNGKLSFVIRTWNDRGIVAMLEPSITGELDQDNVNLVVEPSTPTRARLQTGPHRFIAARGQPVVIPVYPKSAFCTTQATAMHDWCPGGAVIGGAIVTPCGTWGLADCSIEIFRQKPFVNPTQPQIDHYTPKLKPGFVISSVEIQIASFNHDDSVDVRTLSPTTVNAKQVFIRVPVVPDPMGGYDSLYGVKFFAVGPIGVTNPLVDGQQ